MDIKELQTEMRKKGAFSKYCSNCHETFGSDDIDKFLTMVGKHKC